MLKRLAILSLLSVSAMSLLPGCAVSRDQETVGAYIDDTSVTTAVKARFVKAESVDASSISVETLQGTVLLSGFAKSDAERQAAETLTREVKGVKSVTNRIMVRKPAAQ